MPTSEKSKEYQERYQAAMHGVQSGVAMLIERGDGGAATPKHLRVGVNAAMIDASALAKTLIDAGIVDEEKYLENLCYFAERERESYEQKLSDLTGFKIDLA